MLGAQDQDGNLVSLGGWSESRRSQCCILPGLRAQRLVGLFLTYMSSSFILDAWHCRCRIWVSSSLLWLSKHYPTLSGLWVSDKESCFLWWAFWVASHVSSSTFFCRALSLSLEYGIPRFEFLWVYPSKILPSFSDVKIKAFCTG